MRLGAHHFVLTGGAKVLKMPRTSDHLLIRGDNHPDLSLYFPILSFRASIYPHQVPAGFEDWILPFMHFSPKGVNIHFATSGPRDEISKMLDFAVLHGVKPVLDKFPLTKEGIDTSLRKLLDGKIRYRAVLVA